MIKNW